MRFTDTHLIALTVLTVVVVFGSIGLIFYRFNEAGMSITGFAIQQQSASVNVSIGDVVSITFQNNSTLMEFGNGTLQDPITRLNTTGTTTVGNPGGFSKPSPFVVENDGTVYANVTTNGTTGASFIGTGTTFEYAGQANSAACPSANLSSGRRNFTAARNQLCDQLNFSSGSGGTDDEMNLTVFIVIPIDVPSAGVKTATVEIAARKAP